MLHHQTSMGVRSIDVAFLVEMIMVLCLMRKWDKYISVHLFCVGFTKFRAWFLCPYLAPPEKLVIKKTCYIV